MNKEAKREQSETSEVEAKCFVCERTDSEATLLAVRERGSNKWVCAQCLPRLIHGG